MEAGEQPVQARGFGLVFGHQILKDARLGFSWAQSGSPRSGSGRSIA